MKTTVLLLLVITVAVACNSRINPPEAVKNSFAKQFPDVSAKWEAEDGKYEATFSSGKQEMTATFEENGTLTESEVEIAIAELPAGVKDYISTHYNGASVKEAAKITLPNGSIQYEAAIKEKDIIFDAAGNFLKEIAQE